MHPHISQIVLSEEQISTRVRELGARITADYAGEPVMVVGILRGAAIFMADLVRSIDLPVEMDFMAVSSYGTSATSSGQLKILKDLSSSAEGKRIIIVEDILDTGLTLSKLVPILMERDALSVDVCVLLRKEGTQKADVPCSYVGFPCPNGFVVGYGLDYAEHYRNLPYIGILKPEVYSS